MTTAAPKPGPVFYVGRTVLRPYLRLRYRPRVSGRDRVPSTGPVLLASNHLSSLDTILIPSFTPRRVQFLAKASLFSSRLGGWFFRQVGAIPVHRQASSAAQAALDAGREVLAAGSVFAIFPEGSRSRDGRLHQGRGGLARVRDRGDHRAGGVDRHRSIAPRPADRQARSRRAALRRAARSRRPRGPSRRACASRGDRAHHDGDPGPHRAAACRRAR